MKLITAKIIKRPSSYSRVAARFYVQASYAVEGHSCKIKMFSRSCVHHPINIVRKISSDTAEGHFCVRDAYELWNPPKQKISKRSWSCSRAAARFYVCLTQLSAMCAKLKFSSDRTLNFKSLLFGQRLHYLWKSSQQKSNNNNISFICMTICRVTICTNDNTLQWLEWSIKCHQYDLMTNYYVNLYIMRQISTNVNLQKNSVNSSKAGMFLLELLHAFLFITLSILYQIMRSAISGWEVEYTDRIIYWALQD